VLHARLLWQYFSKESRMKELWLSREEGTSRNLNHQARLMALHFISPKLSTLQWTRRVSLRCKEEERWWIQISVGCVEQRGSKGVIAQVNDPVTLKTKKVRYETLKIRSTPTPAMFVAPFGTIYRSVVLSVWQVSMHDADNKCLMCTGK